MKPSLVPSRLIILAMLLVLTGIACNPVETATQAPPPVASATAAKPVADPAPVQPPAELPRPVAEPALPGKVVLDSATLVFSAGGWKLGPRGRKAIQQIADELKVLGPGPTLVVSGYSSDTGTPARKLALSRQRAEFVARALTSAGVPRAKITMRGLGSENPIADNATKEGRVRNQRVEVEFQRSQEGRQ